MKPIEVLHIIRTLLDSGREWYLNLPNVEQLIHDSQIKVIEYYLRIGEERPIRPLFVYENIDITTTSKNLIELQHPLLEPRNCVLSLYKTNIGIIELYNRQLAYVPPHKLISYNSISNNVSNLVDDPSTMIAQRLGYWTYKQSWDVSNQKDITTVEINDHDNALLLMGGYRLNLEIGYVRVPNKFSIENNIGLEVTKEIQYEVAAVAAESINNMDVLEYERGLAAPPESGARVTLDKTGRPI